MANPFSIKVRLHSAFTRLPVTAGIVLAASLLYAWTLYVSLNDSDNPGRSPHPGAMSVLEINIFPEIHGHFDLWRGHVWRLFFNAMHHDGFWHLLLNSLSLWILGDLLERRMGRLKYLLFFLIAGYVSVLAQSLLGDNPIGMSGAVCAVFGYLLVLRKHDIDVADRLPPAMVNMGFVLLIAMVPLTAVGLIRIANVAHFTGLGYGWLLGWLHFRSARSSRWKTRLAVAGVHAAVVALTLAAMHPVWNGRYQAWLGWQAHMEKDYETALRYWRTATRLNPAIAVAWAGQAEILARRGRKQEAWQTALEGLRLNRTDEELDQFVRELWSEWRTDRLRCDAALAELHEVFGDEANAWIRRLKLEPPPPIRHPLDITELLALVKKEETRPPRLDMELDVPSNVAGITTRHPAPLEPGEVNPQAPDSAILGETL